MRGPRGYQPTPVDPVTLMIPDLFKPRVEGLETIMRLRRQGCGTKILAVSGVGRADFCLHTAVLMGADAGLAKTRPVCELLTTIKRLIHTNSACTPKIPESAADKE